MNTARIPRLAMAVAGVMLAHQFASKAVRDTAFLSTWTADRLPLMVLSTAVAVVAVVPVYARLLARFAPRVVVPAGFLVSAVLHVIEWRLSFRHPWVAVAVYLHIAGLGALLLSGFWSLVSELFDPKAARANYGRIAATGTVGGLLGIFIAARLTSAWSLDATLLFLAAVHAACAAGVWRLGRIAATVRLPAARPPEPDHLFGREWLGALPHVKTLGFLIALSTAAAAIVDFLLKAHARSRFSADADLAQFFYLFYAVIGAVTFLSQAAVGPVVRRAGLRRTISSLPAGLGMTSLLAFLIPAWPMFVVVRGVESVLRGSMFRSGYELLFVPMDPAEKRRTKTFLDVTCDRAGDAMGAAIVQGVLLSLPLFLWAGLPPDQTVALWLLACVVVMAAGAIWLARRLDVMYLGVVERQLVRHAGAPVVIGSETGWTVIDVATPARSDRTAALASVATPPPVQRVEDPRMRALADLRSGDRERAERALAGLSNPDRIHVVQAIQLLAWDDVVIPARNLLTRVAASHVGLLVDVLVDPETDFAIRRRIPRILATLSSERALDGLVRGLDDQRFEVRYQCSRALTRLLAKTPGATVAPERILAVVERELSVPVQIWRGHRLIDRVEGDDDAGPAPERVPQNLEHIFALLASVLPREPVQVALRGINSDNPGLRGLAVEYLDSVLAPSMRTKLYQLVGS